MKSDNFNQDGGELFVKPKFTIRDTTSPLRFDFVHASRHHPTSSDQR